MTAFDWPIKSPHIMGIVNLTPDSFSDGGRYTDPSTALTHIEQLEKDGANSIDLGAESTRPGAIPIDSATEINRLKPVLTQTNTTLPISIDTQKATVADWALENGATLINDVSGLRDPDMARVVAQANCPVIIMHMEGTPETMQDRPRYNDVIDALYQYFEERLEFASKHGIQKVILDPGIGFGKTLDHNLDILANLDRFNALGCPVMIGTSNKSFIGKLIESEPQERLGGSLSSALLALQKGAQLFRVHDVAAHHQAFTVWNQVQTRVQ